ncbi:MAG: thrombospondin type 3 repeat-containing protein [Pseudomonadota bacterium]|nr:thrombospondin type 3 repeat-containing protein [Pseudomonadota bacterium]
MFLQLFSLLIASASASSSYPAALEDELGMPCAPTCTVCHETNAGGPGTVLKDFGLALMARDLTGGADIPSLQAALAAMEADAVDSDGDGMSDLDELAAGADPNPGAAVFCEPDGGGEVIVPVYGCFGASGTAAGMGLVSLLGLTTLRRRARR